MAKRVAAQRRGLLYGLIGVIFVAVIMTVLFFLQANEVQKLRELYVGDPTKTTEIEAIQAKLRDQIGGLRDRGILPSGESVSLDKAIDKLRDRNDLYEGDISTLANEITGQSPTDVQGQALHSRVTDIAARATRARTEATRVLEIAPNAGITGTEIKKPGDLVQAIQELGIHVEAVVKDHKEKMNEIQKLESDKVALQEQWQAEVKKINETFKELADTKDARIAELDKKIAEAQDQVDRTRREYEAARKAHNEYVNQVKAEMQKLTNEIVLLNSEMKVLSRRIARAEARQFEPDGYVIRLAPGETTGYINLGKGQAVFNGLTFMVFAPDELSKAQPQPKGYIRLTNVMDNSSEFGITRLEKRSDPIVEGDLITNAAFDLERPFHFAVVGRFDINGDGAEDTEWVKSKIRSFGGKVQDKVDVETDYLVAGDDPMNWAPTVSTGTLSPQQQIILESLKKEQETFGEATDLAQRLHIPVLNLNRFLSLMGIPNG